MMVCLLVVVLDLRLWAFWICGFDCAVLVVLVCLFDCVCCLVLAFIVVCVDCAACGLWWLSYFSCGFVGGFGLLQMCVLWLFSCIICGWFWLWCILFDLFLSVYVWFGCGNCAV